MGFSRQEYWSGLPFPSPGDLPDPGIEPGSPALQADTLTSEPPGGGEVDCIFFPSFFYTRAQQEMRFEVSNEVEHILFSQQCFGT